MTTNDIAARNRRNYLHAKQAFNDGDLEACLAFYSASHQLWSQPSPPGRDSIRGFLEQSRCAWPGLQLLVEHAVAQDEWVMGRSIAKAMHSTQVFGVPPTGRSIETTFWDLHRFDADGLIVESWNLLDGMTVLGALRLLPTGQG